MKGESFLNMLGRLKDEGEKPHSARTTLTDHLTQLEPFESRRTALHLSEAATALQTDPSESATALHPTALQFDPLAEKGEAERAPLTQFAESGGATMLRENLDGRTEIAPPGWEEAERGAPLTQLAEPAASTMLRENFDAHTQLEPPELGDLEEPRDAPATAVRPDAAETQLVPGGGTQFAVGHETQLEPEESGPPPAIDLTWLQDHFRKEAQAAEFFDYDVLALRGQDRNLEFRAREEWEGRAEPSDEEDESEREYRRDSVLEGLAQAFAAAAERMLAAAERRAGYDHGTPPHRGWVDRLQPPGFGVNWPNYGAEEDYAAASPAMDLTSMTGTRGAGGWGRGSGRFSNTMTDRLEPARRHPLG